MAKNKKQSTAAANAKRRAAQHQSGGGFSYLKLPDGVETFDVKKGKYIVNILNYKVGKGNPWADEGTEHFERTFWIHRNIGTDNRSYICPRQTAGKRCPICEYRATLLKKGNEADKDLIASLRPQERQLFNVNDVTNGKSDDIKIWDISNYCFGKQLDGEINDADDDSYANFGDIEEGYSLKLGVDEEKGKGFSFNMVNRVSFKDRKYPISKELAEKLVCLDDILVIPDYDKLKKEFMQADDLDDEDKDKVEEDVDDEDEKEEEKPSKKASKPVDDDEEDDEEDDKPAKASKPSKKVDEDEDEEDDDEDDKPAKKSSKKATKPVDEEDDEDEEKPSKKTSKKKPVDDDDEDDEEDDWDDDDEEDDEDDD